MASKEQRKANEEAARVAIRARRAVVAELKQTQNAFDRIEERRPLVIRDRYAAIRRAHAAGMHDYQIADVLGLSITRVGQLRREANRASTR